MPSLRSCVFATVLTAGLPAWAGDSAPPGLNLTIAGGAAATNSILSDWAVPVTIEVRDETGAPVAGALVTVLLPSDGPGASFAWGSAVDTRQTSSDGRVVFNGLRLRHIPGDFPIRVTAAARGLRATATTTQDVTGSTGGRTTWSRRRLLMLGIGGAGAAIGTYAALRGGGDTVNAAPTITPGIPIVTGPRQ